MCVEHIETLIQDNKFIDVVTPCGYHYEFNSDDYEGYPKCWMLVRNNALNCSNIELECIFKLAKHIHGDNSYGLTYLWSEINKFVNVYSDFFTISHSMSILQTIAELEVLRLKVGKGIKEKFRGV